MIEAVQHNEQARKEYRIMSAFEIGAEPLSRKRTGHSLENKSYGIGEENLFCRGVFPPLNDGTEYKSTRRLSANERFEQHFISKYTKSSTATRVRQKHK